MKNNIMIVRRYTPGLVKKNPHIYYVFGDNLEERGKRGQAIIRDLSNTIGVPTKKSPSMREDAFFTDKELRKNKKAIANAFKKIYKKMEEGYTIALPEAGLGTGLAKLETKAPKTNDYLLKQLAFLIS